MRTCPRCGSATGTPAAALGGGHADARATRCSRRGQGANSASRPGAPPRSPAMRLFEHGRSSPGCRAPQDCGCCARGARSWSRGSEELGQCAVHLRQCAVHLRQCAEELAHWHEHKLHGKVPKVHWHEHKLHGKVPKVRWHQDKLHGKVPKVRWHQDKLHGSLPSSPRQLTELQGPQDLVRFHCCNSCGAGGGATGRGSGRGNRGRSRRAAGC
jgi:hypothetical protein